MQENRLRGLEPVDEVQKGLLLLSSSSLLGQSSVFPNLALPTFTEAMGSINIQ